MVRKNRYLTKEASDIIRKVMKEKDMHYDDLASKMGITYQAIGSLFRQRNGTTKERYEQMYNALGQDKRVFFLCEFGNHLYYSTMSRKLETRLYSDLSGRSNIFSDAPTLDNALKPYFFKINELYKSNPPNDSKLKVMRSLDAIILNLEREEK